MKQEYKPYLYATLSIAAIFGIGFYFRKQIKDLSDYIFTDNITYHLNQLNPKYRNRFAQFIDKIQKMGYSVQINSSYRDFASQSKQHDADTRNPPAGHSLHNYGAATDLQVSKNGKTYGKGTSDAEWLSTGIPQLAKSMGITWGGDNDVFGSYQDAVHFDIRDVMPDQLLAMAEKQFGTKDPSKIIGNKVKIA